MKILLSGTSEDYLKKTVSKFMEGRRRKVYVARLEYRSMKGQTKKFQKTVEFQG
jgi:hypothetical protein